MSSKISFEQALSDLEGAVAQLESGNMSLDESIETFEKAVKLIKLCNEMLEGCERKVSILIQGADGTVSDKPFEIDADET